MRPLPRPHTAKACRRQPPVWTAVCAVCICCVGLAAWGADTGPLRATDPPDLLPAYRVHEPQELLTGSDDRVFEAGSGIQLVAWEPEHDHEQTESTTAAATDSIGADPLARIQWPEADTGVDAGATLRGIAEGAGLVLAMAVVGLWALRQWLVKRSLVEGAGRNLRRLDSLSLPQRCHVHLLDVQGRRVLVAIDSGGVKGVTVLPDSFDALIDTPADDAAPSGENGRRVNAVFPESNFA